MTERYLGYEQGHLREGLFGTSLHGILGVQACILNAKSSQRNHSKLIIEFSSTFTEKIVAQNNSLNISHPTFWNTSKKSRLNFMADWQAAPIEDDEEDWLSHLASPDEPDHREALQVLTGAFETADFVPDCMPEDEMTM
ncbi:hypothetical protein K438DRAFT_1753541 [Mycena galopus ATCC 62051]|nr:hypothetical protein K438DRAFT_1753541 [Mycena galopus ATCC 62051]